jgi:hypothetical protein
MKKKITKYYEWGQRPVEPWEIYTLIGITIFWLVFITIFVFIIK